MCFARCSLPLLGFDDASSTSVPQESSMLLVSRCSERLGIDKGGSYTHLLGSSGIFMGWEKCVLPGERAPRAFCKDSIECGRPPGLQPRAPP